MTHPISAVGKFAVLGCCISLLYSTYLFCNSKMIVRIIKLTICNF